MADGTSYTHERTTTVTIGGTAADLGNYGERKITVGLAVNGSTETGAVAEAISVSKELAAVASGVSNLTVERGGDGGDEITATWFGPGSLGLDHRIALYVTVDATTGQREWIVFPGTRASDASAIDAVAEARATTIPGDTGPDKWGKWSWTFDLDVDGNSNPTDASDSTWPDDDGGSEHTVEGDDLRGAMKLRVDTKVDGGTKWTKRTEAAIPAPGG